VGEAAGVHVVDDYGHHPTEIAATLRAAAGLGFGRVRVVFQPHRYSRTAALAAEFGHAFDDADEVLVLDVFSAGETPIPGISGKTVVRSVEAANPAADVRYMPNRSEVVLYVASTSRPGDLVITMGAGDVTVLGPSLVEALSALPARS
jgi:UDP-N-acetylmuramate--alanine ligase